MKFTLEEAQPVESGLPKIKVIGLGGGGGNAVDYMVRTQIDSVDFVCANTDIQALNNALTEHCIQLGSNGLGAGANPEKGAQATKESIDQVKEAIKDADMLFIAAGMGGGTGTGAAPIVAQVAREMGILTVGIVSKPFSFERRGKIADAGIAALAEQVDSLITVPNDKLLKVLGKDFVLAKAFDYANEVLHGAVQGITELVTCPGLINVDFEDLRTVMSERGVAMMGVGHATGEDRASKATEKAIANPLLEDIAVSGARGLLVNVTSGLDFTLGDFNEVGDVIDKVASADAKVIIGTSIDETMEDEIRVTIVATGLSEVSSAATKLEIVKPDLVAVKAVKQEEMELEIAVKEIKLEADTCLVTPELVRPKITVNGGVESSTESSANYLDIPAFLRRQQD